MFFSRNYLKTININDLGYLKRRLFITW